MRAITYDCWGTLLRDRDWDGAMKLRVDALSSALDLSEHEAWACLLKAWKKHDEAWSKHDAFGPGRMAAFCLRAFGVEDAGLLARVTREFEEATLVTGAVAVDGAEQTLAELAGGGVLLGLICDTGVTPSRVVRKLLDENGLTPYLRVLRFSDEVGVTKPGIRMFHSALNQLDVAPSNAAHVGDLRRTDVAGARAAGMRSIRFRGVRDDDSDTPEADAIIDRHEEILEVLARWSRRDSTSPPAEGGEDD